MQRKRIDLIEHCAEDDRRDFVTDILIRYKNLKKIYGYKIKDYWSNISTVDAYYQTNMDFLKPEVREYFFRTQPGIYSLWRVEVSLMVQSRIRFFSRRHSWGTTVSLRIPLFLMMSISETMHILRTVL